MFDTEFSVAIIAAFAREPPNRGCLSKGEPVRIELDSFASRKSGFAHKYAGGELNFSDERIRLVENPEISGVLTRDDEKITVKGKLAGQVQVDCDRCLQPITIPVAADFHLTYVTPAQYQAGNVAELESDDLELSIFDGEGIDLDDVTREQILLAVPERVLCREDCRGICPVCGTDRNLTECTCERTETDPRWAALNDLHF